MFTKYFVKIFGDQIFVLPYNTGPNNDQTMFFKICFPVLNSILKRDNMIYFSKKNFIETFLLNLFKDKN